MKRCLLYIAALMLTGTTALACGAYETQITPEIMKLALSVRKR